MEKLEKTKRVVELAVIEDLEESGVTAVSLVDEPAIEKYWVYLKQHNFVDPQSGETQDEFIGRCMSKLVGDEGYEKEQAYAICINTYENKSKQQKFADYPWDQCQADMEAKGYDQESRDKLCGWIRANMEKIQLKEYPWDQCIADAEERGADDPEALCGWIRWNMSSGINTSGLSPYVDQVPKKKKKFAEECPPATQDIALNLKNRQKAIDVAHYGPLNPAEPSEEYWQAKADKFKTTVAEAKTARCGNCAFFVQTPGVLDCIASGIGQEPQTDPFDSVEAGDLGYCEAFDFKCAAARTCDAWVTGGPITEEFAEEGLEGVCDEGYEAYGLKELNGRMVPNCVPIKNSKFTRISEYNTKFATDEDQKIIVGAAMIPDMEIFRRDEDGKEYYVKFSKETIAKVAEKFMKELRVHSTNLEHDETVNANSFVFESWLTETLSDKANTKYNLDVPVGTWMLKLKVSDPAVWEAVKAGKYKGFSIEGNFVDKQELENIEKEKEMVEKIMRILNS